MDTSNTATIRGVDFKTRYAKLNPRQKQAVDTIDGPLMVVAGPGTGKTELLSMRAANILKQTDTLPENILCLTFTESGAAAMRQRLSEIIGPSAYKVAIHTFHSFGSEIINQYGEYFYQGANFRPASELNAYEVMRSIFDTLPFNDPLASKMNGEYTHLYDSFILISELKKSGLTSDELLRLLDANESVLDAVEQDFAAIFANRISKGTVSELTAAANTLAHLPNEPFLANISPLANVLALSLAHAIDAANDTNSTKPITSWKNDHFEKNERGEFVFKDRKRTRKLRALSHVYYQYLLRMQEMELYDFDDMVLRVVHAMEVFPELRYNLQEKYLYIMVDEFQDTNLAQARILHNLTNTETTDSPNIMVVGDDDQAIYSFQGAEVGNILNFRDKYENLNIITLTDNYRSANTILESARSVILQGQNRLEQYVSEIDKTLQAHRKVTASHVKLLEYASVGEERQGLVAAIKAEIEQGTAPSDITVLARRHHELVELLPYFTKAGITINYERRNNVLESDVIKQLLLLARVINFMSKGQIEQANNLLPRLFSHPAWDIPAHKIWQLSISAYRNNTYWIDQMATDPDMIVLYEWFTETHKLAHHQPAEYLLDRLIGSSNSEEVTKTFTSPLYGYFFSTEQLAETPDTYLTYLEALRAIRTKLREYYPNKTLLLSDFVVFIDLHEQMDIAITSTRSRADSAPEAVNLMTAHKSKGLEFGSVYIIGAVDTAWGERVRTRSRLISYPENLPISPSGDTLDERLRLFFVAMTRAKNRLTISYATNDSNGKALLPASFLVQDSLTRETIAPAKTIDEQVQELELEWYSPYVSLAQSDMRQLLSHTLGSYKLSLTHLTSFLDVTRGGPNYFLINNLLHFPRAKHPSAVYGTAMHEVLQHAHAHLTATGKTKPVEDILQDFEQRIQESRIPSDQATKYLQQGTHSLSTFLRAQYASFNPSQKVELNFSHQESRVGDAALTGALDLVDIDTTLREITVIDYKTGSPTATWQGKSDTEKLKLHTYRQQLMFYKLMVEHSRDFGNYTVTKGVIQFVEPTQHDEIQALEMTFSQEDLAQFAQLLTTVYRLITDLSLPDTSIYTQDYKGVLAFEADLISGKY